MANLANTAPAKSVIDLVFEQLSEIKELVTIAGKNVLTLSDVCTITGLSKSHIYKLTSANMIPYYRPSGKFIYFDRKEIEAWLKQGKVSTNKEIERRAEVWEQ